MKRTKVIASVGPASNCIEVMSEMVNNGMDCARINLSHATEEDILKIIDVVRKVRKICNKPIAIMYDTKGPEFRTLKFKDGGVSLKKGETIKMSKTCILGNENEFGVNHSEAIDFIKLGNKVLIDNALLELEVIEKKDDYVVLKALGNGDIKDHKTINVPGVDLKLDFISEVDEKDIAFAATHACDYLALSFVTAKEDVIAARKIIEDAGGDALIISKIESHKGIENIDDIIDVSDGIMVARGDLGENANNKSTTKKNAVKRASLQLLLQRCWLPCMKIQDLQGLKCQMWLMQYWMEPIVSCCLERPPLENTQLNPLK